MAVLIPDIGIPKTCSDCPCYDAEYEMCNLTKTEIVWSRPALTSRAEDCPLIEIVRCKECGLFTLPDPVKFTDDRVIICLSENPDGFCHNGTPREEDDDV